MSVDALVIGGGLAGITTAHRLAKRGQSVVLIEAKQDVGLGANFANGAMLCPSQATPWNTPGILTKLLSYMIKQNSPLRISPKAIPSLFGWGIHFVKNSKPDLYERNTRALFELAHYSMEVFHEYYESSANKFDAKKSGTIKIYRDQSSFEDQIRANHQLSDFGLIWEKLNPNQLIQAEPHLKGIGKDLVGGIRFSNDVVADSTKFCQILRDELLTSGQSVHVDCRANKLLFSGSKVIGAQTTKGEIRATNTILALGADTAKFLPNAKNSIHIRPAKGYSLTYDTDTINDLPTNAIVDEGLKMALVPINGKFRIVGCAEFAGHDLNINRKKIQRLHQLTKSVYPDLAPVFDSSEKNPWAGLRPVSADGLPYIGETPANGLWINCGHGHLGWTLATGSAELLADLITKKPTKIGSSPFAVVR